MLLILLPLIIIIIIITLIILILVLEKKNESPSTSQYELEELERRPQNLNSQYEHERNFLRRLEIWKLKRNFLEKIGGVVTVLLKT